MSRTNGAPSRRKDQREALFHICFGDCDRPKIPLRARRGHCLVRPLLALALIASGCSSDNAPAVEGSLNFEVLDVTGNGGAGADGPTAAVATAARRSSPSCGRNSGANQQHRSMAALVSSPTSVFSISTQLSSRCRAPTPGLSTSVQTGKRRATSPMPSAPPWSLSQLKRSYRPKRSRSQSPKGLAATVRTLRTNSGLVL